ncbi:hypothetical protein RS9916_26309 [Synechococcus sp. RS9916]|nr:hypothetical protein RS9916_26309 [Synechococcus sp. RS9916]
MVGLMVRAFGLNRSPFRRHPAAWLTLPATAALLTACGRSAQLPDCVTGTPAPTATQTQRWEAASPRSSLELAIDGSSSMLGLTGSASAQSAWKALLKGVSLSAAANGLSVKPVRIGSGKSTPITSTSLATNPCFFSGCGAFRPVTSSLGSLWEQPGLSQGAPPLRVAITDLEVNDGDISKLVKAIKPHVTEGAVIGILAVRLPFEGNVFNSQGTVIHKGEAERPTYLLATGPQAQLHSFLRDIKTKSALAGVPTSSMQLTLLDEQANAPTLLAKNVTSNPADQIREVPLRLGDQTYSPYSNASYQFARLESGVESLSLSTGTNPATDLQPDLGLVNIGGIALPAIDTGIKGIRTTGFQLRGTDLTVAIDIPKSKIGGALRANVPRGQLPEAWWVAWNRSDPTAKQAPNQTDGLLLLFTSLSKLMVESGTTPAASLCLAFSR